MFFVASDKRLSIKNIKFNPFQIPTKHNHRDTMFKTTCKCLLLQTLIFCQTSAICNYFYPDTKPVQLDSCYYSTQDYSYGFYCVDSFENYTFSEPTVVELKFYEANCPDGAEGDAYFYNGPYNCSDYGDDCQCDGKPSDCTVATSVSCNESYPITETYVYDICISFNAELGSKKITCDETDGVEEAWYSEIECGGSRVFTPAPTETPAPTDASECATISCAASMEESGLSDGLIVVIVLVCVCVPICIVVAVILCIKKKQAGDAYFENKDATGDARL